MRIAIITQPLISNFGGILQNYALQKTLKGMGQDPITIDIDPSPSFFRLLIRYIHLFIANKGRFVKPDTYKRNPIVESFLKTNVSLTPRVKSFRNNPEFSKFDAYIVGSDQVWRYSYNKPFIKDMYLDFTRGCCCRRMSYAASFGDSTWDYPDKITKECKRNISMFDAVSVREKSAIKLCQENYQITPTLVLDPTLLVNESVYFDLCKDVPKKTNILLSYILDLDNSKKYFVEKVAKELNLLPVFLTEKRDGGVSVEEWLSYFRDGSFIITDSYHGTVFSIIFHKNFLSIVNKKRGEDRFITLLNEMGLGNRMINSDLNEFMMPENINWVEHKAILETKRRGSIRFLREGLSLN